MIAWIKRFLESFRKRKEKLNECNNVVDSIGKSKKLYKELIIQAHPDRNPNKKELAINFTERINNNRYNYKALLKIQKEIEETLLIK